MYVVLFVHVHQSVVMLDFFCLFVLQCNKRRKSIKKFNDSQVFKKNKIHIQWPQKVFGNVSHN